MPQCVCSVRDTVKPAFTTDHCEHASAMCERPQVYGLSKSNTAYSALQQRTTYGTFTTSVLLPKYP